MKNKFGLILLCFSFFMVGRFFTIITTCKDSHKEGYRKGSFETGVYFNEPITPKITDSLYSGWIIYYSN